MKFTAGTTRNLNFSIQSLPFVWFLPRIASIGSHRSSRIFWVSSHSLSNPYHSSCWGGLKYRTTQFPVTRWTQTDSYSLISCSPRSKIGTRASWYFAGWSSNWHGRTLPLLGRSSSWTPSPYDSAVLRHDTDLLGIGFSLSNKAHLESHLFIILAFCPSKHLSKSRKPVYCNSLNSGTLPDNIKHFVC